MREKYYPLTSILFLFFIVVLFYSCVDSEISRTTNASVATNSGNSSGSNEQATETSSISGTAIDVFTGAPLSETWLCLEDGTTCTVTDSNGNYSFEDIPFGDHTITPYDGDGGSILKYDADGNGLDSSDPNYQGFSFTLDGDTPTSGFQVSTGNSQKLSGSVTIITTWKDASDGGTADIDSHLIIPLGGSCDTPNNSDDRYFEDSSSNPYTVLDYVSILSGVRAFSYDSSPFATLDLDDVGTDSSPTHNTHMETMKVKLGTNNAPKCSGTYHFYLNNYGDSGDTFNDLQVKVRVLVNGGIEADYVANDSSAKKFWGVFNLNSDGSITSINSINSSNEYIDACEDLYPELGTVSSKCADSD
jgi:hypothetical protein